MTPKEIVDYIKASEKRERVKLKERAQMDYTHTSTLASFVSAIIIGKNKPPTIYEAYEKLFVEEAEQKRQADLKAQIESMKAHISSVGKIRKVNQ